MSYRKCATALTAIIILIFTAGYLIFLTPDHYHHRPFNAVIFSQIWQTDECSVAYQGTTTNCNAQQWKIKYLVPVQRYETQRNCPNSYKAKLEIAGLENALSRRWAFQNNHPADWDYIWRRLGTCFQGTTKLGTPKRYFWQSLRLAERYDMFKILKCRNIVPGGSYTTKEIADAIKDILGADPLITCELDETIYLSILHLCFDENLEITSCNKLFPGRVFDPKCGVEGDLIYYTPCIVLDKKHDVAARSADNEYYEIIPGTSTPPGEYGSMNYELIVFSQVWQPSLCTKGLCPYRHSHDWAINGLWPEYFLRNNWSDINGPTFCSNSSVHFDSLHLKFIEDDLRKNWLKRKGYTRMEQLEVEYKKYGTCFLEQELKGAPNYFSTALEWKKIYNMTAILQPAYDNPSYYQNLSDIYELVLNATKNKPMMKCIFKERSTGNVSYLAQIDICFNKSLNIVDCDIGTEMQDEMITNCDIDVPILYGQPLPSRGYKAPYNRGSMIRVTIHFYIANIYMTISVVVMYWFPDLLTRYF